LNEHSTKSLDDEIDELAVKIQKQVKLGELRLQKWNESFTERQNKHTNLEAGLERDLEV